MRFAEIDAAIAAGATLSELKDWLEGNRFSIPFKAKILAWHNMKGMIKTHSEDARNRALKARSKKK